MTTRKITFQVRSRHELHSAIQWAVTLGLMIFASDSDEEIVIMDSPSVQSVIEVPVYAREWFKCEREGLPKMPVLTVELDIPAQYLRGGEE